QVSDPAPDRVALQDHLDEQGTLPFERSSPVLPPFRLFHGSPPLLSLRYHPTPLRALLAELEPMGLVLRSDANASAELLGGKATALARLARAGMRIPPWFVVPPPLDSRAPSVEMRQELEAAWRALFRAWESLAGRSSALVDA